MKSLSPLATILLGFVLVLLGAVLAWLMALRIIPTTNFVLPFISYAASISGLMLGFIGGALYIRINKNNKDK